MSGIITMSGSSYVHNDWLSTFACKRAGNKFSLYLHPCPHNADHYSINGLSNDNSNKTNMAGIAMHIIAIASAIFSSLYFLIMPAFFISTASALALTIPGLFLGALCIISDIRDYNSRYPDIMSIEQIKNFFANHPVHC